jgi:hypothetical protein
VTLISGEAFRRIESGQGAPLAALLPRTDREQSMQTMDTLCDPRWVCAERKSVR